MYSSAMYVNQMTKLWETDQIIVHFHICPSSLINVELETDIRISTAAFF